MNDFTDSFGWYPGNVISCNRICSLINFRDVKFTIAVDRVTVTQFHMLGAERLFLSLRWWLQHRIEVSVAQQLLEVRRRSISVNVIWHSTQRQLRGADDSLKPCLWRLHAWRCWAVIWSSHAKADRQTALSQAVRQPGSQCFHRDDNTSVSATIVYNSA